MKNLRKFESKSEHDLTEDQLDFLNQYVKGEWSYNTETGFVDVLGDFRASDEGLSDLCGINFGVVTGSFNISENNGIQSLKGSPRKVTDFYCQDCMIETLEGSPDHVTRIFDCSKNILRSLEGGPKIVGSGILRNLDGYYKCDYNNLENLKGAPEFVRAFICRGNGLKTLEGGPKKASVIDASFNKLKNLVGCPDSHPLRNLSLGEFDFSDNKMVSLQGSPKKIYGSFSVKENFISDLSYCPEVVLGNFAISDNLDLKSLKGPLKKVSGDYFCNDNIGIDSLEGIPDFIGGKLHIDRTSVIDLEPIKTWIKNPDENFSLPRSIAYMGCKMSENFMNRVYTEMIDAKESFSDAFVNNYKVLERIFEDSAEYLVKHYIDKLPEPKRSDATARIFVNSKFNIY